MHSDDEKWVKNKINELPTVKLKLVAWECYKRRYEDAFNTELVDFKKSNVARCSANTALRLYVDRVNLKNLTGLMSESK